MKLFAQLIHNLSHCKDSELKASIISKYFQSNETEVDKDIALNLLLGQSLKRIVTSKKLAEWTSEITKYPRWLIDRSEQEVGNHIQTLNLLLRQKKQGDTATGLPEWLAVIERLRDSSDEEIKDFIKEKLSEVGELERLNILKLMTGTFKLPATKMDVVSGLALALKLDPWIVNLRMFENRKKPQVSINNLEQEIENESMKIPCIFPEINAIDQLGEIDLEHEEGMVFGKKDGLEVQLIKHGESVHLWTRGGNLITDKFPEIIESISLDSPDFKCYGQIIPKKEEVPIDHLVARFNRKSISGKDISNCEAIFELWEVLEGDVNQNSFIDLPNIRIIKSIKFSSKKKLVELHKNCRIQGFSGFMMKPENQSKYYSWKAASFSIKAVLMYAEIGGMENSGIRSVTFGVYREKELLPIAKIMEFDSFFDAEEVIGFVKENTIERFGPVRTVKPQLVYRIEFDGISKSIRRKSGLVLSNPKISGKVENDLMQVNNLQYLTDLM